jgi:hypothetical protein
VAHRRLALDLHVRLEVNERFEWYRVRWRGGVSDEAAARLEPLRGRLVAGWNEETNPVELIFIGDTVEEDPSGQAAGEKNRRRNLRRRNCRPAPHQGGGWGGVPYPPLPR